MKIKRIKQIKINSYFFKIDWDKSHNGASFNYRDTKITIGTLNRDDDQLLMLICHELWEICAVEMNVRMHRPDVDDDYLFVYDHRQHETMTNMFASLVSQFIQ